MTIPNTRVEETKLHVPLPPKQAVDRQELMALLSDSIRERRLTLIEAPAGSGKTTALASWIAREQPRVAWITLDERDNRGERFLAHLIAAAAQFSGPPVELDERLLDDDGREEVFQDLIRSLGALDLVAHLVLDDYHFVQSIEVHEMVERLVEAAPETLHIVIASRTSPQLPLARWRVRLQLGEIQNEHLRFVDEEASALVRDVSGVELSPQSLEVLNTRAEGWVAGLQLAALSIRSSVDPEGFVNDFSGDHRHVLDFLLEEVWSTLDGNLKGHLIRLSIVNRFCAGLCDALSRGQGGQEVLERIDRANLFLVPLDNRRSWFRFHRLFADFLERQLARSDNDSQSLHRRAADWFTERGDLDSELEHRYRAQDWSRFTDSVVASQRQVWTLPPDAWFRDAVLEVPEEETLRNLRFLELLVPYLVSVGDIPRALQKLQLLDRATEGAGAGARAPLQAMRAFLLAVRGDDDDAAVKLARAAIETASAEDAATKSRATLALAISALNRGDALVAEELLSVEATAERRSASYFTFLGALIRRAQAALSLGRLELMFKWLEELELERRQRGRVPIVPIQLLRCHASLLRAEYAECEQALRGAFSLTEEGRVQWVHEAHILSARLHLCCGNPEMAKRALGEATALATQGGSERRLREARALRAGVALDQGENVEMDVWLEDVLSNGYSSNPLVEERERFVVTRISIETGQVAQGLEALAPALDRARSQERTAAMVEGLCLSALAASQEGLREGAAKTVADALDLAHEERLCLPFVELQARLSPILHEVRSKFDPLLPNRGAEFPDRLARDQGLDEPLSERELEVLVELLSGSTNERIATNLYVSKNTVKTHLRNIYAKLGVHNRGQAVAKANALGIAAEN